MPVVLSKILTKKKNFDITNLAQWFQVNKIALYVNKTDIVIFQYPRKQFTKKLTSVSVVKKFNKEPALNI